MRDFRDAKAMAQTLREALKEKSTSLTHSESLELVARILGCGDWNVLAARIESAKPASAPGNPPHAHADRNTPGLKVAPVIPLRDLVVFPFMTGPIFIGREKSRRAIERAMAESRPLLVLTQKQSGDDDPAPDALHQFGVTAVALNIVNLPDGTMKLTIQGVERARPKRIWTEDCLMSEIEVVQEDNAPTDVAALAEKVLQQFATYANIDLSAPPQALIRLPYLREFPGLLADNIAQHLSANIEQRQEVLSTTSVVERLERIMAIMQKRQAA